MNSLFLQGVVYSALTIGTLTALAWWLYLSPMRQRAGRGATEAVRQMEPVGASARLSYTLALLVGVGSLLISFGGYWDASEHVITGIVPGGEDFLWPPHLMLYAGFLLAFLVAVSGLAAMAVPNLKLGIRDPRRWVRRNPYVGAVVLIAGYGLASIPGDAIWHELYGLDLTAWSPPHIFLALSASFLAVFAAGLLLRGGNEEKRSLEPGGRKGHRAAQAQSGRDIPGQQISAFASAVDWRGMVQLIYLAIALLLFVTIGTLEWEIDTINEWVVRRPIWLYPTIIGVSSFFLLILGRRLAPGPWTATVVALFYFGLRIAVTSFAEAVSGAPPRLTLVFVLGALLLDLTCQWMARFGFQTSDWQMRLAAAGAFTVGYALVAQPTIQFYLLQFLPSFTVPDHLLTVLFTFLLCAAMYPVAVGLGNWLQHTAREETPPAVSTLAKS